ncbi:S66 peptidase family protein [Aeoliella mucimassa]|uniref:S66 peptidase family protein n=1 Tax=Aeoliella mucimassa TaxID=2527972 RepID=UPI0018D441F5|nr:LD-carboxypeptidase [Aeoliella mucimassa]
MLSAGDAISIIAPAGPINPDALERAVAILHARGLRTKTYRDLTSRYKYLAGTDRDRAAEFNAAIHDPETKAILPVRGGYGVVRILEHLDLGALANTPKLLCGFSDITALHTSINRHAGVATIHGPNLQDGIGHVDGLDEWVASYYWNALMGEPCTTPPMAAEMPRPHFMHSGSASGPLVGGNLAVFTGLIGTPYLPNTSGAILLLEDVGEEAYRIDRLLSQCRLAGLFSELAGVVLGQFTANPNEEPIDDERLSELFEECFAPLGIPVLANYPVGHIRCNLPVPLGTRVELSETAGLMIPNRPDVPLVSS